MRGATRRGINANRCNTTGNALRRSTIHRRKSNRGFRQTTSRTKSALVSILGPAYISGKRCADLYAGTGGVGIELLNRNAESVTFVERDARRVAAIRSELRRRNLDHRATVHRLDAIKWLQLSDGGRYDILFADPPYESTDLEALIHAIDVSEQLMPDANVILEHSSRLAPPQPEPDANLTLLRTREYGDTSLTMYQVNRHPEQR